MDHERAQLEKTWIEGMVKVMLGDENLTSLKSFHNQPIVPFHQGDTYLHEKLDEVEQFFFSLLPSFGNRLTGNQITLEIFDHLIEMFWLFIRTRHKIFGPIGVRVGWELVALTENKNDQAIILNGKFEIKGDESLIN